MCMFGFRKCIDGLKGTELPPLDFRGARTAGKGANTFEWSASAHEQHLLKCWIALDEYDGQCYTR